MNKQLQKLFKIAQKEERLIVGLMSGTSVDGLDLALCWVYGHGEHTQLAVERFLTIPYQEHTIARVKNVQSKGNVNEQELCVLNTLLGDLHAQMVLYSLEKWGVQPQDVDLIASHGQTIYHAPQHVHQEIGVGHTTLQIGDGDHIAQGTGIITIADVRQKHTAAGGEGAPLAPVFDQLLFRHADEHRVLLNLGGIANFTWLPSTGSQLKVMATDTGPANTIVNEAMQQLYDRDYDHQGEVAIQGTVIMPWLEELKSHSFFAQPAPKSTGQELFNLKWATSLNSYPSDAKPEDTVATLSELTVETVMQTIQKILKGEKAEIFVSGGGVHNRYMMQGITKGLPGCTVSLVQDLGISPDAKEACMMAVFANELVAGEGFKIDDLDTTLHLGKICLPG
ncbi:MAG: anhydro-N-acetylmuramic acid kinase [Bacteroidota bacterium]